MSIPGFDDSRIKDYPDKKLLENIRRYYELFTSGDADAQKNLETEDFTMTDISLGFLRFPREQWFDTTAFLATLLIDVRVTAISLYGSSKPGGFSILEHLIEFTLAVDPPPGTAEQLPPGTKKGDRLSMINLDASWWTEEGKLTRQLVYGRLTWNGFDFHQFDPPK